MLRSGETVSLAGAGADVRQKILAGLVQLVLDRSIRTRARDQVIRGE